MTTPAARINYLNNRDLLAEIHRSKLSYCYFVDERYEAYDMIVSSLDDITEELIEEARDKCVTKANQVQKVKAGQPKSLAPVISRDDIQTEDIVWRVMTFDHIPLDGNRSKNPKTESEKHRKTNFPPFKHYIIRDFETIEVGRSHWVDSLQNGTFRQDQGTINRRLAQMFMTLVDRYSQRSNWRGYTYVSEMRGQALLQLSLVGLQFDEARSENPFAYFTVVTANAFTRVLNLEKRNQNIRDYILIMSGATPSITRQLDDSLQQKAQNAEDGEETIAVPVLETKMPKRSMFGRPITVK